MQQTTMTLIVAGLGIAGTFGGILTGHFLTRSWQREQWRLDRRQEEWRELLTALAESLRVSLKIYPARALSPEEQIAIVEAQSQSFRTIRDRIFIAHQVKEMNIEDKWTAAVNHHSETLDAARLCKIYDGLRNEIVKAATGVHVNRAKG